MKSFKARSAERRREVQAKLYYERKANGLCTKCGDPAVDGSQMCAPCLDRHRAAVKEASRRLRNERRDRGLCAWCGSAKTAEWACLGCKVARGWSPTSTAIPTAIPPGSDPAPSPFRVSNDGRTRYHGQMKRGRQPVSQLDDQDLESAMEQIRKAREQLAIANSPAVAALPRHERESAKRAALALAEHGTRFVDEVLDRHQFGGGNELRMTRMAATEIRKRGGR